MEDEVIDKFAENLVIMDDQTWIWALVKQTLEQASREFVRIPSSSPIRHSWNRFKNADRIVIHWESKERAGGAIVEEIIGVAPRYDVGEKIIVVTTNPTHEDVVYFSELGVRRIVRIRNRDKDRESAQKDLATHLSGPYGRDKREEAWLKVLRAIDTLPEDPPAEVLEKLESTLAKLAEKTPTARQLDAKGSLHWLRKEDKEAHAAWHLALEKNPNYYRTYHNLIAYHRSKNDLTNAMALMQKMQGLNRQNIARLVGMGELQMALKDEAKAEFYFKSALDRDRYCSGALNGLAEIRFHQGDLEESRKLLARSHLAYKTAANMNRLGIELVQLGKYAEALDHYTRAQYVLPQQDKGPLLFYNIGLCYAKWNRLQMAQEFLQIALIKEPNYKKAKKLLDSIATKLGGDTASRKAS